MFSKKEEKIALKFRAGVNGENSDNLNYYQKLEEKVSTIETILGINIINQYDLKINYKLERALGEIDEFNLNSDEVQKRIKILIDEIDQLKNKKKDINFNDILFQKVFVFL